VSGTAHGIPRPTFASVMPKRAVSDATTRSHICTNAQPPAYATPLTAAITGFATWIFTLSVGRKFRGKVPSLRDAISLRSAPAQNAFSPAPGRIATRPVYALA